MLKKTLMLVPAVMLALSLTPESAPAQNACIAGCDADFPGTSVEHIAIRGWCYILRGCWQAET